MASQILQSKDIEIYFQRQWDKIETTYNPILLNKLISVQYYLHHLFQKFSDGLDFRRNNYMGFFQGLVDSLIQKGDEEKALIVSFNYDTILEQSLSKALHYTYHNLDDYINIDNHKFALLKPHGSCNWGRSYTDEFLNSLQIHKNGSVVSISQALYKRQISLGKINSCLSNKSKLVDASDLKYYFPQLLIPFKSKDSFIMPESHTMFLEKFLDQIDKIIILGWKGAEEKFKSLLKKQLGDKKVWVLYANAKDDSIQRELQSVFRNATISEIVHENSIISTFTELNTFIQEYPDAIF